MKFNKLIILLYNTTTTSIIYLSLFPYRDRLISK